jgi:hypothetical protein
MSTLTRATVYAVRISARTTVTPLLAGAAASSATAKLVGWELRQLASSPLSAEARHLRSELHTLAVASADTPEGREGYTGNGRDRRAGNSTFVAVRPQ